MYVILPIGDHSKMYRHTAIEIQYRLGRVCSRKQVRAPCRDDVFVSPLGPAQSDLP